MTGSAWQWPAGLRCWQLRKLRCYFTRHENHLQLLGDGGGSPGLAVTIVGIAFSQNYSVERDGA